MLTIYQKAKSVNFVIFFNNATFDRRTEKKKRGRVHLLQDEQEEEWNEQEEEWMATEERRAEKEDIEEWRATEEPILDLLQCKVQ